MSWLASVLAVVAWAGDPERIGLVSHKSLGLLAWSMALAEPKSLDGVEPAAKAFGAGDWHCPCWQGSLLQRPVLMEVVTGKNVAASRGVPGPGCGVALLCGGFGMKPVAAAFL